MIPDKVVFSVPAKSALALDEMARTRQRANRTGSSFLSLPRKGHNHVCSQLCCTALQFHQMVVAKMLGPENWRMTLGPTLETKMMVSPTTNKNKKEVIILMLKKKARAPRTVVKGKRVLPRQQRRRRCFRNGGKDHSSTNERIDDGSKGKKVSSNEEKDSEEEEEEEREDGDPKARTKTLCHQESKRGR